MLDIFANGYCLLGLIVAVLGAVIAGGAWLAGRLWAGSDNRVATAADKIFRAGLLIELLGIAVFIVAWLWGVSPGPGAATGQ